MINPLIGMPQGAEWLVILAIVILVFGAAKLPGPRARHRPGAADLQVRDQGPQGRRRGRASRPADRTPAAELPRLPTDEAPTAQDRQTDTHNG